ncbi:hypothetical protein AGMMS49975_04850 [Clostridia bacterium]|nr:hypothetical protein AGMMS49975_04850 [Clostridia bacterium]
MAIEDYVDVKGGLKRVANMKKIYLKTLNMFLASGEFDKFETALAAGDLNAAGDVAHAIKGMTGNLSFPKLFEYSASLMTSLHGGELDSDTIEKYRDALKKTREYVAQWVAENG